MRVEYRMVIVQQSDEENIMKKTIALLLVGTILAGCIIAVNSFSGKSIAVVSLVGLFILALFLANIRAKEIKKQRENIEQELEPIRRQIDEATTAPQLKHPTLARMQDRVFSIFLSCPPIALTTEEPFEPSSDRTFVFPSLADLV